VTTAWQFYPQKKPTVLSSLKFTLRTWCDRDSSHMAGQHWRINTLCHSPYLRVLYLDAILKGSTLFETELFWEPKNPEQS
jgi:hypothetical protein